MLNLLEYALKHCKAIDIVTQWHELGLRDLELTDEEWAIIEQLQSVERETVLRSSYVLHPTHLLVARLRR